MIRQFIIDEFNNRYGTSYKKLNDFSSEDMEFVTNKRQQNCLENCRKSLIQALNAAKIQELQVNYATGQYLNIEFATV